jgi:hypothetical protein
LSEGVLHLDYQRQKGWDEQGDRKVEMDKTLISPISEIDEAVIPWVKVDRRKEGG